MSEDANSSVQLELQHVSLHEVIPYMLIPQEGSKPRKQFQARTSRRRDWERCNQFYRQEKLVKAVQRKRTMELQRREDVEHAMGKLAREENRVTRLSETMFESSPTEEINPELAIVLDSQHRLGDVASAVAMIWSQKK
ncbi:hypothetical protein ACMFMG_012042 [Clarireedia jacksonii]